MTAHDRRSLTAPSTAGPVCDLSPPAEEWLRSYPTRRREPMLGPEEMAELVAWHLEHGRVDLSSPGRRGARAARDVEGRLLREWLAALRPGRAATATEARVLWRDPQRRRARMIRHRTDGTVDWHMGDVRPDVLDRDRLALDALDAVRSALGAEADGDHEAIVDMAWARAARACERAAHAHGREDVIGPFGTRQIERGRVYGERARTIALREAIASARASATLVEGSRSRAFQVALLAVEEVTGIPEGVLRTARRDRSHTV